MYRKYHLNFQYMIKYANKVMIKTIIDQIEKFFRNLFNFEFVSKKPGNTNINTAIKKIADIKFSKFIIYSKNFWLFEKIF